jgi:hypothetical protein
MPAQRVAGMFEFQAAADFVQAARDFVHALIADRRRNAFQRKPVPAGKHAAELAAAIAVIGNRPARDPERMACGKDTLPCSFEHLVSRVARIDAARGLSVPVDCFGKFDRVVHRLVEN